MNNQKGFICPLTLQRCDCQEKEEDRPGAVNAGTVEGETEGYQPTVSSSSLHE